MRGLLDAIMRGLLRPELMPLPEILLLAVSLVLILPVIAACFIAKKAGYAWAWGLLFLVPVGNVIAPILLAFLDWPVLRELRALRAKTVPPPLDQP